MTLDVLVLKTLYCTVSTTSLLVDAPMLEMLESAADLEVSYS